MVIKLAGCCGAAADIVASADALLILALMSYETSEGALHALLDTVPSIWGVAHGSTSTYRKVCDLFTDWVWGWLRICLIMHMLHRTGSSHSDLSLRGCCCHWLYRVALAGLPTHKAGHVVK